MKGIVNEAGGDQLSVNSGGIARVKSGGELQIDAGATVDLNENLSMNTVGKGVVLKRGANGLCGTFVNNGTTGVDTANTNVAITDTIVFSLNTIGSTVGAIPRIDTITAGVGFTTKGTASDTSTYNYTILKNQA